MSALAALVRAYDRLPDAPPFGYARVEVSFCIVLSPNGAVPFQPIDLRIHSGSKPINRRMELPTPLVQRTSGIKPNFLWDKSEYSLGITSGNKEKAKKKFAAFVEFHERHLSSSQDIGLLALLHFLKSWEPNKFSGLGWPDEIVDANVIFALENEYRERYLHQRASSITLWDELMVSKPALEANCLVLGESGRIADSHPPIKKVNNAQSSGAFIVSFNSDAYQSYDHKSGDNAPISEQVAFKYTTALNLLLERDSGHRVQIGDASTVFWADTSDVALAEQAEGMFASFMEPANSAAEEEAISKTIGIQLARIRKGEPLREIEPQLAEGVRFFVLGLAPNAARLSVRFYYEESFGKLTENYQRFVADMAIAPPPREAFPQLWQYLRETAVQGKRENIAPNLAGEWMRAILTGGRYPLPLLSSILTRIRADGTVNAQRASLLKAVLIRNFNKEVPVALDPENTDRGYLLGRLFATYEQAQRAALGDKVNATIKDKFYGAASAQPRKVFHMLESGSANHLSKVGKASPGRRINLERQIAAIMDVMDPGADPFPASLSAAEQALFGLGYYHQRNDFFKKTNDDKAPEAGAGETAA